jgi:ribose transport system substrate-binding protein
MGFHGVGINLKVLMAGVTLGLAALAAGCGDDDDSSAGSGGEAAAEPVKVAFILPALNNSYWNAIKQGAEEEAESLGDVVDVSISSGQDPAANDQIIAKIQDAQTKGADVLAVVVNDGNALAPVLKGAVDDGTPVVAMNAALPDSVGAATFIGTDELEGGSRGGDAMTEALPDGGKVGILHCFPGNPTSDARVAGFKEAIAGSEIEVVSELDAKCDATKTPAVMNDMLTAHPDLAGVFSISDDQTIPATRVIEKAGKTDQIAVVGYDAIPEARALIREGSVFASVAQFPQKMGSEGVKAALAAAQGDKVEERINTGTLAVTADNVEQFEKEL